MLFSDSQTCSTYREVTVMTLMILNNTKQVFFLVVESLKIYCADGYSAIEQLEISILYMGNMNCHKSSCGMWKMKTKHFLEMKKIHISSEKSPLMILKCFNIYQRNSPLNFNP